MLLVKCWRVLANNCDWQLFILLRGTTKLTFNKAWVPWYKKGWKTLLLRNLGEGTSENSENENLEKIVFIKCSEFNHRLITYRISQINIIFTFHRLETQKPNPGCSTSNVLLNVTKVVVVAELANVVNATNVCTSCFWGCCCICWC